MGNEMILLVEDNKDERDLAILAFKQTKVPVQLVTVPNGEEALEFLLPADSGAHGKDQIKIVLLDLKLPKIDGMDVLRRIRGNSRTRYLPVAILSSSLEPADLIECYRLGANSYLRKPVSFPEFLELAQRIVGYWVQFNQTAAADGA